MWLAESCFEGAQEPFRKCLLPGKSYTFGRKAPADLILADKTVSKESATLHVDLAHAAASGQKWPTLRIHAHKRLVRVISQENEEEWKEDKERFIGDVVDADSERHLRPGDTVALTKSAPSIKFLWQPIVICAISKVSKDDIDQRLETCNSLGIYLEKSKQLPSGATHLLVPNTAVLTVQIMQALASAVHLVTIFFIDEMIRRAQLNRDEDQSWEKRYCLPDPQLYFPSDMQVEDMNARQVKETLNAKVSRMTLFVGTTLLFLHDESGLRKSSEQVAQICKSSGARIVMADASTLTEDEAMMRLLRRNKSEAQTLLAECGERASEAPDEGLVVICDTTDSETDWYRRAVLMTRQMAIAMPPTGPIAINHAILHADARRYLNKLHDEALAEDIADQSETITTLPPTMPPPTMPPVEQQEGSTEKGPTRGIDAVAKDSDAVMREEELSRKSPVPVSLPAPTPASTSASVPDSKGTTQSPRKPKRRADMARRDPLEDIFGPSTAGSSIANPVSESTNEQTQQSTARPRRYENGESQRPRISETFRSLFDTAGTGQDAGAAEATRAAINTSSRTKKYRDELDESDRLASQRQSQAPQNAFSRSQMNYEGATAVKRRMQSLPREEPRRTRQRHSQVMRGEGDDDVPVEPGSNMVEEDPTRESQVARPQVASQENTVVGEGEVIKEKKANTTTDEGGTDDKFLQAMATSKRSKKSLDQFDREFNLLRIAKPNHATGHHGSIVADVDDPEYRAWEQMAPSDFDINAAGNFVQVDFVPLVYQRTEAEEKERGERQRSIQNEWKGRPNFKKFKTKARPVRAPVAMDIEPEVDYGLGDGYIRPSRSRAQREDTEDEGESVSVSVSDAKQGSLRRGTQVVRSLSEVYEGEQMPSTRRPTQRTRTQTRKRRRDESGANSEDDDDDDRGRKKTDLRLDVDADIDDSIMQPRGRNTSTQQGASLSASGGKRGVIDLSSDEDDMGSTFSGFRKKKRRA